MRARRISLLTAALLAISPSVVAQDLRPGVPSVLYFVSFPLDGTTRKDKEPLVGFAYQGSRAYQVVRFDTRVMNFLEAGGFEAKWLIAGALAAGAVVAVAGKDKSITQQEQQQQQAQQQAQPCPKVPAC